MIRVARLASILASLVLLFATITSTRQAFAGAEQSRQTLSSLTVPAGALPIGCALEQPAPKPAQAPRSGVIVLGGMMQRGFPSNPWTGTDRKLLAAVRKAIDGAPRMPDGPPLEAREAAAFELRLADNVLEAYHAVYGPADRPQVEVHAITFSDAALAKPDPLSAMMNPPRGLRSRLVRGATVVVVSGVAPPNECFRAIETHIGSLKMAGERPGGGDR